MSVWELTDCGLKFDNERDFILRIEAKKSEAWGNESVKVLHQSVLWAFLHNPWN